MNEPGEDKPGWRWRSWLAQSLLGTLVAAVLAVVFENLSSPDLLKLIKDADAEGLRAVQLLRPLELANSFVDHLLLKPQIEGWQASVDAQAADCRERASIRTAQSASRTLPVMAPAPAVASTLCRIRAEDRQRQSGQMRKAAESDCEAQYFLLSDRPMRDATATVESRSACYATGDALLQLAALDPACGQEADRVSHVRAPDDDESTRYLGSDGQSLCRINLLGLGTDRICAVQADHGIALVATDTDYAVLDTSTDVFKCLQTARSLSLDLSKPYGLSGLALLAYPLMALLATLYDLTTGGSPAGILFIGIQALNGGLIAAYLLVRVPLHPWALILLFPVAVVAIASLLAVPLQWIMLGGLYALKPLTGFGDGCSGLVFCGMSLWRLLWHFGENFTHHHVDAGLHKILTKD